MPRTVKKVYHRHVIEEMIEHCKSGLLWNNYRILGYTEHLTSVEFEMVSVASVASDEFDYEKFSHIDDEGCVHFETPMSSTFIFSRSDLDKLCKLFGCEVKEINKCLK